ncbi:MAG: hypothetical protein DMG07_04755 [Acidobacteria bacterium]|nr:MAG: hypothetical protein DMG07_04755 [Acidobacteriota bacterium]
MTDPLIPARDPLGRGMPADLVETFAPLGAILRLETNSSEVLDACRQSFGGFGAPPAEGPAFSLRLLVDSSFRGSPPWPQPVFRGTGDIFFASLGPDNTAVADLASGFATGLVSPALARDTRQLRKVFIDGLVLTLLTQGGASTHSYVHASAVSRGGRGLLFSGPSRSGKSTLAFACARRGFEVVSDDVVYLAERGGELAAWGKPWLLRLLPECRALFPELAAASPHVLLDGEETVEVDVDGFFPGRARVCCRPEAVFFLERAGGAARLEPIEPGRALALLGRDLVYDRPEVLERHARLWTKLVARGAFRLDSAEDLDDAVDLVESFLAATRD